MKRHFIAIGIILFFSYWAIKPLFTPGFFPMHDDTQVSRVIVMGKALRDGQFPVRWVSDLGYGYGYPIFNFYGPLPYYFGGALYALGVDAIAATKIMFAAGILLAGVAMYALAYAFVGKEGAILAALLYVYAPYHAVQVYVRGAVGEYWAFAFLPLIPLGFSYVRNKNKHALIIGAIGLAGTIVSHTILGYVTTLFFILFLFVYWLARVFRKSFDRSSFSSHMLMLILGLALSAFFWLPALAEMRFTSVSAQIGGTANFRDHFVCVTQFWDSLWGYGGSIPGCVDGLSFRLGKIHILLAALSFVLLLLQWRKQQKFSFAMKMSVVIFFVSVFFMIPLSEAVWNVIPFFAYIQYPWRFLAFAVFALSLASGGIVLIKHQFFRWFLLFALLPLIIFIYGKLFVPQYTYMPTSQFFESKEDLRFRVSKISDEYLPGEIERPKSAIDIVHDTIPQQTWVSVATEISTDTYSKFAIAASGDQQILIRKAYFPGWEYLVNGKKVVPVLERGLPKIAVPSGDNNVVEIIFRNTPARTLGNAISVLTIITFLFIYGKKTIA